MSSLYTSGRENGVSLCWERNSLMVNAALTRNSTVRGVITCVTGTSLMLSRLLRIFDSPSASSPLSLASSAMADSSSRMRGTSMLRAKRLVICCENQTNGVRHHTIQSRITALAGASWRQYAAPMVLGTISDSTRMPSVNTAENTPSHWLPKTTAACAPALAAPMVWAMVFKVRIDASGRSMSPLSRASFSADGCACWRNCAR
ncbi:hypothetical protein VIB_000172 [Vibrio metschnikovii CIP 69.14]|nr:hypothetical protein VIB_000172 [Vibrio metschnikovii CIP 69.14]